MESQQNTGLTSGGRKAGHAKEMGTASEAALRESSSMDMPDLAVLILVLCPKPSFLKNVLNVSNAVLEHLTFKPLHIPRAALLELVSVGECYSFKV